MSSKYSRGILKIVVAQLCQTIGWHAVHSTPLDLLTDVLQKYITELGENSHRYAEQFGHTDPNLHDLGLAFRDMGINIADLEEYVQYVTSVPCAKEVPKYPIERESHLNLLKPGSREVVTRPVHIHEHLPAMHPELEDDEYGVKAHSLSVDVNIGAESASPPLSSPKTNLFKRPGDPITLENSALKRARLIEEEGRPLREISSVMMTTSGFLSPAREGKLPEARTPTTTTDSNSRSNSPQPSPSSYPTVPPEVKGEKKMKKNPSIKSSLEGIKKMDTESKLKEFSPLESLMTDDDDSKVKKLISMKETTKLKALKSGALKMMAQNNLNSSNLSNKQNVKIKNKVPPANAAINSLNVLIPKVSKTTPAKSPKVEAIVPPSSVNLHKPQPVEKVKNFSGVDGKLPSEPDRQKLNIFKKISKVKEESKIDYNEGSNKNSSIPSSSNANGQTKEGDWASINETIESVIQQSSKIFSDKETKDVTLPSPIITNVLPPSNPVNIDIPLSDNDSYQFDSPPGTPRTPEVPVIQRKIDSKRKRKDKMKEKRENKERFLSSPKHIKSEPIEPEFIEKPKTPELESSSDDLGPPTIIPTPSPVFPFFQNFAPGLIPPPIGHPVLFPGFPPLGKHGALIPPHPTMPNLPLPPPLFMQPPRTSITEDIMPPRNKLVPPPLVTTPPQSVTSPLNSAPHKPDILPPPITVPPALSVVKMEPLDKPILLTPPVQLPHVKEKSKDERKKEHKKEKKDKIKKKKDKKDKTKNKEKSEKKKDKTEKKERDKEKIKEKKEKKEKKREKEREQAMAAAAAAAAAAASSAVAAAPSEKCEERASAVTGNTSINSSHSNSVPKITLKLGPSSPQPVQQIPPTIPETPHRKIVIKPVKKPEEIAEEKPRHVEEANRSGSSQSGREPSPELARICALVTRPPKQKPLSKNQFPIELTSASPGPSKPKRPTLSQPSPKIKSKESSKKAAKEPEPVKEAAPAAFYYDTEGNQVWICPGCGGQDDGSPMIGCDGCDAWYHWVCVGIQVPPDSNDWFCRVCIGKNNEGVGEKKKKMRKKKNQIKAN